jgi:hypothetical protein
VNDQPQQPGGPEGAAPNEEELRAAFEEEMKRIHVGDVILQTAVTLVNLAARRLGLAAEPGQDTSGERDLNQAKLAIEGVRALLPLCPPEQAEQIAPALSQLQMAFVQEAGGVPGPGEAPAGPGEAPADPAQQAPQASPEDEERAKARAKLWTPPGA